MKRTLVTYSALAGTAAAVFLVGCSRHATPLESLHGVLRALETRDVAAFEKLVDVETLLTRLSSDIESTARLSGDGDDIGGLAQSLIGLFRPTAVLSMKEEILRTVESWPTPEETGSTTGETLLRVTSAPLGFGNFEFKDVSEPAVHGKTATVDLIFHSEVLDQDFHLTLMLRDVESQWRLVEISDAPALVELMREAERRRLRELNEPVVSRMMSTLDVLHVGKGLTRTDEHGRRIVDVGLRVMNKADQIVESFVLDITALDPSGGVLTSFPLSYARPIAPSDIGEGVWSIDVDELPPGGRRFFRIDRKEVEFDVQFRAIVLEDGTALRLYTSVMDAQNALGG